MPLDEQAAVIAAIREAVPELVVNARVDVFLRGGGDVDEAVERANAYLAAGADCVYPILCPPGSIAELARRIDGPMNVIADAGVPGPAELRGARRRAPHVGRRPRGRRLRRGGRAWWRTPAAPEGGG